MPEIPALTDTGFLPPGIYNATLPECVNRFGSGSEKREGLARLLSDVVSAAREYPTIKRVLVWGSFVTDKSEPNDLDYSLIVSVLHSKTVIRPEHRRFLALPDARATYGVDRGYLLVSDYPLDVYVMRLDFLFKTRKEDTVGILEIVTE